jgi:arginyl-tRNA synthetase
VIPGDIGAQLAAILRAAAAAGDLLPQAAGMTATGTWRRVPAASGGAPGRYATSLPFALAWLTGGSPAELARQLAAPLSEAPGIAAASATGRGYLTVTVTEAALCGLAPRVAAAGPACARSTALAGVQVPAPPGTYLAAAGDWREAWRWQAAAVTARLAAAAGATITPSAKRDFPPAAVHPPSAVHPPPVIPEAPAVSSLAPAPVAVAIEYAGLDAVRYALTRTAADRAAVMGQLICVSHVRGNPWYEVTLAHAEAASTLRWAADLGLQRGGPAEVAAGALSHPRERALLDELSWLPERVSGAARRAQPHEIAAYTEDLAGAWSSCRESCPALPFGGAAALRDPAGVTARLWLADATRTALAAALTLIGVAAPDRV